MPRPTDADEKEFLLRALNTATMRLFRDEDIYFQPLDDLADGQYEAVTYAMGEEDRTQEWDEVQDDMSDQLNFDDQRGKDLLARFRPVAPLTPPE